MEQEIQKQLEKARNEIAQRLLDKDTELWRFLNSPFPACPETPYIMGKINPNA